VKKVGSFSFLRINIIAFSGKRNDFFLRSFIAFFIFLTCSNPVFAQTIKRRNPLTLRDAIQASIQYYPSLAVDLNKVKALQYQLSLVRDNRLPNLLLVDQATYGTNNVVSGDYFTMGVIPSVTEGKDNPGNNTFVSGNIGMAYGNWQIYDFGANHALVNAAKSNINASQSAMTLDQENLEIQVIKYYFQLLTDYNIVIIQNSNLQRVGSIKNSIAALVKSGIRPGVDTSVANAELSKARLNLMDAKEQYQLSQINLKYLTGIDTSLIIPDTALFQKVINGIQAVGINNDTTVKNKGHPLIQYYTDLYNLNSNLNVSYRRQFYPQLSFTAAAWTRGSSITQDGVYQSEFSTGFYPVYNNYLFGLTLSYNIFNIKRTRDELKQQEMLTNASYQELQLQNNMLSSLVSSADVEVKTNLDKLNEIPIQLEAATRAYSQQLALYNSGLSNIIDVDNTLYILNRAENDKADAINNVWMAILDKAYATNQIDNLIKVF
jgi:outer membrane protein, adhesin transport system